MKSTMSRYMNPGIAKRLVASGAELLGGQSVVATVLFSDIRGFTTITARPFTPQRILEALGKT